MKKLLFLKIGIFALGLFILSSCNNSSHISSSEVSSEQILSSINTSSNNSSVSTSSESFTSSITSSEETSSSISQHVHLFGDWNIISEPTCSKNGQRERSCSCGDKETETIEKLKHIEVTIDSVEPTCTSFGYTEGKKCEKCNVIIVPQEKINLKEHIYDNDLDAHCNECEGERKIDEFLLSISDNSVFGYVKGLRNKAKTKGTVILYDLTNSYITELGSNNEYYFDGIPTGDYYLKIEIPGYRVPSPIKVHIDSEKKILQHLEVELISYDGFYYEWNADETYFGYEECVNVPSEKTFTFLDEEVVVNDSNATEKLLREYKIILSNEELNWTSDYSSRILEIVDGIYEFPREVTSKWILTKDEIDDDIRIQYSDEYNIVYISKSTFENATPRKATYNGAKGTYFSNRLYHACIRYATNEGTNIEYIDRIFQHDYGCSILVEDYAELTRGITDETNAAFEMFKKEELLALLEMFAEMPQGFAHVENLEYLVRRIDGSKNPIYPEAAAVSWVYADVGYIEFMDISFLGSEIEDTFRLILHEKSHFLWEYVFSDEIKSEWTKLGGWYQDPNDPNIWNTSKETEFVTAYAHAHNPDEDMAESIAYYILMPNKLESRSPAKYEFIRDYIMNGEMYVTQIREDLTFEVYNLYPDYSYPGRIVGVKVEVEGEPEEDKLVTVTVKLDTHGDPSFGAESGFMRITSEVLTYYDLWIHSIDDTYSVLQGSFTVSKYSCSGYWYNNQITLNDLVGNQRFVGEDNFGWKMYINNPLEDLTPPEYIYDSIYVEMEPGEYEGRPVTYIYVKFEAIDNIGIENVYCEIANNTTDGYRMDQYGYYDSEKRIGVITYIFTEYMQSGEYSVNHLSLIDPAKNYIGYNFFSDGSGAGKQATFVYYSENSDYEAPTLDVNKIYVTATPTHPENPNGETVVHIEYYVKDDLSGLGLVSYRLLDPLGNTHFEYHYHENFYTTYFEGDPTEWKKYEINVILPEGSAPGKWGLLEFYVSDKAGNFTTYNFLEIIHFQVTTDA